MAKSKAGFEFAQGVDPAQYLENMKKMAEEGLAKSKEAYEQAQASFAQTQKDAEANLHTAQAQTSKISMATLETVRENTESSISYMEKLIGAKSLADVMEIQTSFVSKQVEMATNQAKSMQTLYQNAAEEIASPMKEAAEKAMNAFTPK